MSDATKKPGNALRATRLAPLLVLLLLASCRFPGTVRPTAKIGLVAPFEGRFRHVGYDVIYAVRLAVREANADGGVGGYRVELVAYDDGADPALAAAQARKLAVDPEVVAAIGHFREETTAASLAVYAGAGIPLVAPGLFDPGPGEREGSVVFTGPDARALADVLLDRAEESGVGAVALVSDGGPLGGALVEVSTGRAVAVTPVASLSDSDAGRPPEILTAGVVVCDADPVAAGEAVAMLRTAGWRGEFWGGPSLAASAFAAVAGDAAEGAQYLTPYPFPQDVTGTAGFAEAYTAIAPHVPPPGPLALPAYEAFWILLDALEADLAANGEPTRDGVAGALTSVELPDFQLYWYRVGRGGAISLEGVVPRSIPRS